MLCVWPNTFTKESSVMAKNNKIDIDFALLCEENELELVKGALQGLQFIDDPIMRSFSDFCKKKHEELQTSIKKHKTQKENKL